MTQYNLVVENPESTVVADYQPAERKSTAYQSEADLEKAFIEQLTRQAYDYLPIKTESDLVLNLRKQLEKLNGYPFTNSEWERFFKECIARPDCGIQEKTAIIQEDSVQILTRDDGTKKNIRLIDKNNIHNNSLQVINQYTPRGGARENRYDVTILVNGLPLVHVELKRRGVDIKEAFNQINRYNRESFWAGSGLFEYVQIFVISNGTFSKYYSNTTRFTHLKEQSQKVIGRGKRTSNSFEFTSWWADANNQPITDLTDFTKTFFAKHTILNVLTKYCVFTTDRTLLVMRPYQIVATERILNKINIAHNYKLYGSETDSGGYVWHTTGSGKTLTSFKTAQLATKYSFIDKVLFVVDRKDLDYQTMKEYDRFEKGAANSNKSTAILKKQLEDDECRIIITTIQKLSIFIEKNKKHPVCDKQVVLIFDECHRSQFGDMHTAITKSFKKYYIFGFTGTPIFSKNAVAGANPRLKTTAQAFGQQLHTYTIIDAIRDKNVLPFRVEYIRTMREEENITDKQVPDIDREKALMSPVRISNITSYILEHFDRKTKRNSFYELKSRRLNGFNAIFCTQSIPAAILYYNEFKRQMAALPESKRLKTAIIFSYGVNEDELFGGSFVEDENSDDTSRLDATSRDFLESAIQDYNATFGTNYDTSADKFPNYYKDVSQKVKDRELDLLIVVSMFLTGFDATTLNTLWVDKNLKMHGLLQAFSRTNRILNSIKTFGNIVCFRNLEEATNESIALFGDKDAGGVVLLKTYREYYDGYTDSKGNDIPGYAELIDRLITEFPLGTQILGENAEKDFIRLYGAILRLRNILATFDQFENEQILAPIDFQDYQSVYIDLHEKYRRANEVDKEDINDDIVFEMELVKQVEINIDYILLLIHTYHDSNLQDKEVVVKIRKAINASPELRNKRELIERFIESLTPSSEVDEEWRKYVNEERQRELDEIITSENLDRDETYKFMDNAFKDGYVTSNGTAFTKILPPVNPFAPNNEYSEKKKSILEKIMAFFERFKDIIASNDEQ